ncbi:MAG: AMP-binding protein [Marmoricola sp.]
MTQSPTQPHLAERAARAPEREAAVFVAADGTVSAVRTYVELDQRSLSFAAWLHADGVRPGQVIAVMTPNIPELLEVAWAAQRSGLYVTAVNTHLRRDEAAHVLRDCGARVVVTTPGLVSLVLAAVPDGVQVLITGETESYELALISIDEDDLREVPPLEGDFMLYSSGTTGLPKGIKRQLPELPLGQPPHALALMLGSFGINENSTYLCPAPLYHAAPLAWTMATQRLGGRVVILESFDAATALGVIDGFSVTHAQFVPTMFVRMLKLTDQERETFSGASLQLAIHAAAPCPPEVKRAMIDWWGPILLEFYSATEGIGMTLINSEEWLAHPGSVGKAVMGEPQVLDDEGNELPVGQVGTIWFTGGSSFAYHGDPAKARGAFDAAGRATVGDIGWLDDDGYLYLSDRKDFMIISGGVNVYPQEIENHLVEHPEVLDAAVLGSTDSDLGQVPVAFVQLVLGATVNEEELRNWCRSALSSIKCPRSVTLVDALPRTPTGKLRKHELRDLAEAVR